MAGNLEEKHLICSLFLSCRCSTILNPTSCHFAKDSQFSENRRKKSELDQFPDFPSTYSFLLDFLGTCRLALVQCLRYVRRRIAGIFWVVLNLTVRVLRRICNILVKYGVQTNLSHSPANIWHPPLAETP